MNKWLEIIRTYRALILKNGLLTDTQQAFIDKVDKYCFNRVYMIRPSNYMVNILFSIRPIC